MTIPASVTSIGLQAFSLCFSLTAAYFLGDAPPDDGLAFFSDPATVYYLSGANGWGSTFGGVPAVMLNPFTYTTSGGAVAITGYTGSGGSVAIPATINGDPVTSIGAGAFSGTSITSVTIPASVTTIGSQAFANCPNLTSVTIGNGVTSIGQQAFANCPSLTSVTIGNSVARIGYEAFYDDTSLTTVTIPAGVTTIASAAFYNCNHLTSAYFLGNAPTPDDASIFAGFPAADPATVYYLAGATGWGATFGGVPAVLWNPFTYTVSGGAVTITSYNPIAGLDVVIPATINGNPVTSIAANAFYGTSITSVTIPAGVTSIGSQAFANCTSLTSITVDAANPDYSSLGGVLFDKAQATLIQFPGGLGGTYTIPTSVTSIGPDAFYGDVSITSVTIPATVTSIGMDAFYDCTHLTSANFLGNAPSNDGTAFTGSPANDPATAYFLPGATGWGSMYGGIPAVLVSPFTYTIDGGAVTITGYTGGGGDVVIPATINGFPVTSIGDYAFYNDTTITSVTIPAGVTTIGIAAFEGCASLTRVIIPGTVSSIGGYAFYDDSNLTSVIIPSGVTSIGGQAFAGCSSLTSVTIPASVSNIGDFAFHYCSSLTAAYFLGNAPPDDATIFNADPATVYYLSDTTGWLSMFGSVPAVLWNPQADTLGFTGGRFGFNLTGPPNAVIVVEACTDLSDPVWLPVVTNTLSGLGTVAFTDSQSGGYPIRFYRFRSP